MKIGLFGGSFNPVHNSHLRIAQSLVDNNLVDEVWFIPCSNHAFGKDLVDSKHRKIMIELAIENNKKFKINELELLRSGTSFTSDTLKELMINHPNDDFFWIIGSDNLRGIRQWHDFDFLREKIKFILVERSGYGGYSDSGINIVFRINEKSDLSSTEIRKRIALGESISELVPRKVYDYINQWGLYND